MGLCMSSDGVAPPPKSAAAAAATALVLLPTGELREYPRPATAARVLQDLTADTDEGSGWFVCDSDRMGFEGPVAAVGGGTELRAGRIYFVLPADALRRRGGLAREEVAALAVRAAAALATRAAASGTGRRRRGGGRAAVAPLVFSPTQPEDGDEEETVVNDAEATRKAMAGTAKRRPRRQGRRFAPNLTAIPECDMSHE